MNKTVIGVVVVAALVIAGYVLMKGSYTAPPSGTPAGQASPSEAAASPNTVNISGFAFSPSAITVKAGTTVTWVNEDSVGHNIKSTTFNSPTMQKGDTYQFTFNTKGTYTYNCGIHPSMVGTVTVE